MLATMSTQLRLAALLSPHRQDPIIVSRCMSGRVTTSSSNSRRRELTAGALLPMSRVWKVWLWVLAVAVVAVAMCPVEMAVAVELALEGQSNWRLHRWCQEICMA